MSISTAELVVRHPQKVKGGFLERKVFYERKNLLVGYIFEPGGPGAGYAYLIGPRGWRSGSRNNISSARFKSIIRAKEALAMQL